MRVAEAFGSFGGSKPKGLGKVWHNFLVAFKVFGALFRSHWVRALAGLILGAFLGWTVVGFAVLAAFNNDAQAGGAAPQPLLDVSLLGILALVLIFVAVILAPTLTLTDMGKRIQHAAKIALLVTVTAFLLLIVPSWGPCGSLLLQLYIWWGLSHGYSVIPTISRG